MSSGNCRCGETATHIQTNLAVFLFRCGTLWKHCEVSSVEIGPGFSVGTPLLWKHIRGPIFISFEIKQYYTLRLRYGCFPYIKFLAGEQQPIFRRCFSLNNIYYVFSGCFYTRLGNFKIGSGFCAEC